jgi:hypothetical protein
VRQASVCARLGIAAAASHCTEYVVELWAVHTSLQHLPCWCSHKHLKVTDSVRRASQPRLSVLFMLKEGWKGSAMRMYGSGVCTFFTL